MNLETELSIDCLIGYRSLKHQLTVKSSRIHRLSNFDFLTKCRFCCGTEVDHATQSSVMYFLKITQDEFPDVA